MKRIATLAALAALAPSALAQEARPAGRTISLPPLRDEQDIAIAQALPLDQNAVKTSEPAALTSGWAMTYRSPVYSLSYLHTREVREELGMTLEQSRRYFTLRQEVGKKQLEMRIKSGGFEALEKKEEARRDLWRAWRDLEYAALEELLTPEQRRRHRQVCLQWLGTTALDYAEVADELTLNAAQRARIRAAKQRRDDTMQRQFEEWDEKRKRGEPMPPPLSLPNEDRIKALRDPNTPYNTMRREILAVLTPEQKRQWKEMTGPVVKWLAHSRGHDY